VCLRVFLFLVFFSFIIVQRVRFNNNNCHIHKELVEYIANNNSAFSLTNVGFAADSLTRLQRGPWARNLSQETARRRRNNNIPLSDTYAITTSFTKYWNIVFYHLSLSPTVNESNLTADILHADGNGFMVWVRFNKFDLDKLPDIEYGISESKVACIFKY